MGAKAFTGLDISPKAFSIARANCHEAGLHAKVFNRDCRGFHSDFGYDEILCNLPFGHRVGSHEQNERLYDDILQQWPKILRPGGFVLAVTNDKQLFSALATRHGSLRRWPFLPAGFPLRRSCSNVDFCIEKEEASRFLFFYSAAKRFFIARYSIVTNAVYSTAKMAKLRSPNG